MFFHNAIFPAESQTEKSNKLKEFVREYFKEASHDCDEQKIGLMMPPIDSQVSYSVCTYKSLKLLLIFAYLVQL